MVIDDVVVHEHSEKATYPEKKKRKKTEKHVWLSGRRMHIEE